MKASGAIDLALGVLDHQLLDCENRRCGKVDDLELEGITEGKPRVAALLTGPPAWRGRGRLGRLAARLAHRQTVRVPWAEVEEIGSAIHLRSKSSELRLARGDDHARAWIRKLPWAQ